MTSNENTEQVRLSAIIAGAFVPVHKAIKGRLLTESGDPDLYTEFWLKGGRGSTKSSFAAIEVVMGIMADPDANAMVLRKVGDTIRDSVMATCEWAIETLRVGHLWERTTSPAKLIYKPTGQVILFKGLDTPLKLKSLKVKKGYFKYLWFEEVAEFSGMAEIRSVKQSVLRGGPSYVEFYTYNPPNDPQAWVNKESETPKPGRYVHSSTYLDVPRAWLGEQFIVEAEYLHATNPLAYDHEYMGLAVGIHEAIIFGKHYRVATFEAQPEWEGPYFGGDFGFSQDPATLVKCWLEKAGETRSVDKNGKERVTPRYRLWIEYAEFRKGVELDDYPAFYDLVPDSRKYTIKGDSASPATISHIKSKMFEIVGARKWPGSVEEGITVLKGFVEIVIHTRCADMQQEARLYSYKIDRVTNEVTPDIVDKYNHGWDAVRYALDKYIDKKSKGMLDVW